VDVRLEDHYNKPMTVVNGKVQRGVINRKRGIGVRTLFDGALGSWSTTNLTKIMTQAAGIAFKVAKTSTV
jgi:predicted Zn-dependent protease